MMQRDFFERFLKRGGEILVLLGERLAFPAWPPDFLERADFTALNGESALRPEPVQPLQQMAITGRIAVRGQAHHLVFVVLQIPEERDYFFIKQTERILAWNVQQTAQASAPAIEHRSGQAFTLAI